MSVNTVETMNFTTCEGCKSPCCDGSRFNFLPLILDDFSDVYTQFPIVFAQIMQEWRALIVLTMDGEACRYYKDGLCTIYTSRPPGCQLYPLNPYYDDILIDTSCEALSAESGTFFASKDRVSESFYHKRLENFDLKRKKTVEYLLKLEDQFSFIGEMGDVSLYRYSGKHDDEYIKMHYSSLDMKWIFNQRS
jgi:hypothetical protein